MASSAVSNEWSFLVPIGELYLTDEVQREYRIDRVTLVHKDKLPNVRKRLGIGSTVSDLKKRTYGWNFFDSSQAFAVVRCCGSPEHVEAQCLKLLREELSILAVSQLGYNKRSQMGPIVPPGEVESTYISFFGANSTSPVFFGNWIQRTKSLSQTVIGGRWKNYQDQVFFTGFLKILRGDTNISGSWQKDLRRVAILIGESIGARDLLKSFLWNWIALETLLGSRGEKIERVLPQRMEAILGWARYSLEDPSATYWKLDEYHERIQSVYRKRNDLVHRAKRDDINNADIEFTDHLLLNVLCNLVASPRVFQSKRALIDFSEKVEAERTLGIRPKVRPKDLRYIRSIARPRAKFSVEHRFGSWQALPQWWRDETKLQVNNGTSAMSGSFFRVVNKGEAPASLASAKVSQWSETVLRLESKMLESQGLIQPRDATVIYVPQDVMDTALRRHGIGEGEDVTIVVRDSVGKSHRKSFKTPRYETK